MNVLIYTPYFYPSMGGLETVTDRLASALVDEGIDVEVFTPINIGKAKELERNFKITRSKSLAELSCSVKNCDVFIHNSISLRALLPLFFYRRKWFVVHHMILADGSLKHNILSGLKRFVSKFAKNIAVSKFMADYFGNNSVVIPDPVDVSMIKQADCDIKDKDFVFMGRLLHDKGAHLAIQALAKLDNTNTLTIIGSGPEEQNLIKLAKELKIEGRVIFTGRLDSIELFKEVKRHEVLVVPSIWTEPFGVVVLEGYACGCQVVASEIGGLPDAVGECGILVKPNDVDALALGMQRAMNTSREVSCIDKHLSLHISSSIAKQFIKLF